MKITKSQLKKIIKEELEQSVSDPRGLGEGRAVGITSAVGREAAFELLDRLTEMGSDPKRMLEMILGDFLSGSEAHEAVMFIADEFGVDY